MGPEEGLEAHATLGFLSKNEVSECFWSTDGPFLLRKSKGAQVPLRFNVCMVRTGEAARTHFQEEWVHGQHLFSCAFAYPRGGKGDSLTVQEAQYGEKMHHHTPYLLPHEAPTAETRGVLCTTEFVRFWRVWPHKRGTMVDDAPQKLTTCL